MGPTRSFIAKTEYVATVQRGFVALAHNLADNVTLVHSLANQDNVTLTHS